MIFFYKTLIKTYISFNPNHFNCLKFYISILWMRKKLIIDTSETWQMHQTMVFHQATHTSETSGIFTWSCGYEVHCKIHRGYYKVVMYSECKLSARNFSNVSHVYSQQWRSKCCYCATFEEYYAGNHVVCSLKIK